MNRSEKKMSKANDVCENFVASESNSLFQFYHKAARHEGHYLHKTTCWTMRDLERLTKVCKKSNCAFVILSETSVYVFMDD